MGMRIPSSNAAAATSLSSVAQWQQRTQQVKAQAVVNTQPAPPSKPTATMGQHVNLVA